MSGGRYRGRVVRAVADAAHSAFFLTTLPPTHATAAAELGLPPGTRAMFVLKRRHRLCVTEPEAVDSAGGVEWNTCCTQVQAY